MITVLWLIFIAVASYIVGSFNYSIIVSNVFIQTDIRTKGSGNAGSTNMMRNYGWKAGVTTLITDFLKTVAVTNGAWSVFMLYNPDYTRLAVAVAGFFCAFGHCFPLFFNFKGGKGVAVGAMTILMVDWRCFLVTLAAFLVFTSVTRYVSLGSVMGALSFPITLWFLVDFSKISDIITYVFALILVVMVVFLHRKNIVRIFKGAESKISFKK